MEKLQIKDINAESESTQTPEQIKQRHGLRRAELFGRFLFSKKTNLILESVPGSDVATRLIESAVGKCLSGEQLSSKDRLIYFISAATLAGFYLTGAWSLRIGADILNTIAFGPKIYSEIKQELNKRAPRLSAILNSGEILLRDNWQEARTVFEKLITQIKLQEQELKVIPEII